MPQHAPKSAGFTLIELLVVVSIIAVLVALLTSVNDSIRTSTVTLRCANNLRQIGLGMQAFAQSHRGLLPRLSHAPQPSGYSHAFWSHQVFAEIGDPGAIKLFQCPANKAARSSWAQIEGEWVEGSISYAMPTNDTNARPWLAQNCPVTWHHMRCLLYTSPSPRDH
jgi:prepilin-type N-terminal cleavage/methylation domain-containing protein